MYSNLVLGLGLNNCICICILYLSTYNLPNFKFFNLVTCTIYSESFKIIAHARKTTFLQSSPERQAGGWAPVAFPEGHVGNVLEPDGADQARYAKQGHDPEGVEQISHDSTRLGVDLRVLHDFSPKIGQHGQCH